MNKIVNYMRSEPVQQRFMEILGSQAPAYISSVLMAVANDQTGKLQECAPESIYLAAIRAATLRLSVDPSLGQAYLIPFKGRATLIVGYKGLYDLALRTGKYRYINVGKIYEGEIVEEDRITGHLRIGGHATSSKVVGLIAAFEMLNGYSKAIYMSLEEIHQHAKRYSSLYDMPQGAWKKHTEAMERKTILRILLRQWGYLDPHDQQLINEAEEEFVEGEMLEPVEELIEGEVSKPVAEEQKPQPAGRPLNPMQLAEALAKKASVYEGKSATTKQRGLVAMLLGQIFDDDDDRHLFQEFAFGSASLKDVPDSYILAALDWLKPTQDSGGAYTPDAMAYKEARAVLNMNAIPIESPYPEEEE